MAKPEYSKEWPKVRLKILERDQWLCQIHGPKCKVKATEVDHIIAVVEGGNWLEPRNLRAVCRPCHNTRKAGRTIIVQRSPLDYQASKSW